MKISTHILDTSMGRPAGGVAVTLERLDGDAWCVVSRSRTDSDGRVRSLLPDPDSIPEAQPSPIQRVTFRLRFETAAYFVQRQQPTLYPYIYVVFEAEPDGHYHIPLLLTANGYTTYRGS